MLKVSEVQEILKKVSTSWLNTSLDYFKIQFICWFLAVKYLKRTVGPLNRIITLKKSDPIYYFITDYIVIVIKEWNLI